MKIFSKIMDLIKKHKIICVVVLVGLVVGGYYAYQKFYGASNTTPRYVMAQAKVGTLVTTVSGTGQVVADKQVNVTPKTSGKIISVPVADGQYVAAGQTIAVLDPTDLSLSLAQAQASYDKVINGATQSDIGTSALNVKNTEQDLLNKIYAVHTNIDNLLRTNLDQLFTNATSYSPQFGIVVSQSSNSSITLAPKDYDTGWQISNERARLTSVMADWQKAIDANDINGDGLALAQTSIDVLKKFQTFTTDLNVAVGSINSDQYQSTINSYKSDTASARSTMDSSISDLLSAEQNVVTAKNSLAQLKAPARPEDLVIAESQLSSAKNSYNNTFVTAPFSGQIGSLAAVMGDQGSSGSALAVLISREKHAEVTLNEIDVAKVKVGDKATMTFDALPDLKVSGVVSQVDTIGTVTQGVVEYGVKISINGGQSDQIKPGMSVTVSMITDSKDGALLVPSSAVKSNARGSYVQILPGVAIPSGRVPTVTTTVTPTQVPVKIGKSNDSYTEIVSGLKEGDYIISRAVTTTTTTTNAASVLKNNRGVLGGGGGASVSGAMGGGRGF